MRINWPGSDPGGYWLTPAVFGAVLILIGILIYIEPKLLAYFIAAIFILAGTALIGLAWKMRARITYRPFDQTPPFDDDVD